jgi:recombination protein RecT
LTTQTTQTVAGAVAAREKESGAELAVRHYQDRIAVVLPPHLHADQFTGLALAALYRDVKLRDAANNNVGAFMNALLRCASLGHQPGTEEFYLVPRRNKANRGLPEVQGIEGYRGIVERMYRSGAVKSVIVREVCAADRFRYVEGVTDRPQHSWSAAPDSASMTGADFFGDTGSYDRGPMVGVYAYAILDSGAVSRVVLLNRDDIMAIRAASDGADSQFSPWNRLDGGPDRPGMKGRSMWWKSAARRLEPWVPTSAEYRREIARAQAEAAQLIRQEGFTATFTPDDGDPGDVVDGQVVDEPQQPTGEDGWPEAARPADAS